MARVALITPNQFTKKTEGNGENIGTYIINSFPNDIAKERKNKLISRKTGSLTCTSLYREF